MNCATLAMTKKEVSHARIVEAASKAIRRNGYGGVAVADVMREAGLTHGGFYAHFESRDGMLEEAAASAASSTLEALKGVATSASRDEAFSAIAKSYLSAAHRDNPEVGCPLAALGSETPRQSAAVRRAATRQVKELLDLLSRHSSERRSSGLQERSMAALATMVGTLVLSRLVDEPQLSDALRDAALKQLLT